MDDGSEALELKLSLRKGREKVRHLV